MRGNRRVIVFEKEGGDLLAAKIFLLFSSKFKTKDVKKIVLTKTGFILQKSPIY